MQKVTKLAIANCKTEVYNKVLSKVYSVFTRIDLHKLEPNMPHMRIFWRDKNPKKLITKTISEYDSKKNKTRTSYKDLYRYLKLLKQAG